MSDVVDWISASAGLLAAVGFLVLVGMLAVPLVKLGRTFDAATQSIKDITAHTVPVLDEATTTVATTNAQLVKVDTVTTSAAEISQNVSALAALVSATVGGPLIKVAAFSYGVREALSGLAQKARR